MPNLIVEDRGHVLVSEQPRFATPEALAQCIAHHHYPLPLWIADPVVEIEGDTVKVTERWVKEQE